jgi:histidine kinase-like protein
MWWERTYPPEDECCAAARHASTLALRNAGITGELLDTVVLVLGELVANAVRHARTQFTVAIELAPASLRVEVFDAAPRPPVLVGVGRHALSRRGLQIVSHLSADWGWHGAVRDGLHGKTVWAEIALDHRGTVQLKA